MFLFLLQFVIVFIYCAHGFALAFSLITVRSVSMWLFAFALYTVLLTVIDFLLSQLNVSNLVFFITMNGTMFLFMLLLDIWLAKRV